MAGYTGRFTLSRSTKYYRVKLWEQNLCQSIDDNTRLYVYQSVRKCYIYIYIFKYNVNNRCRANDKKINRKAAASVTTY